MLNLPIYLEKNVLNRLLAYCEENDLARLMLVADQNTYPALGQAVEETLLGRGFEVRTVILTGPEIVADEAHIVQVLLQADPQEQTYLAVGSGTLTDITRFVSHRTRNVFLSIPTAPSVDGFTSIGAPLVIGGLKQTIIAQAPRAVFADLTTLRQAPPAMIAAGFGDMMGKYTSLADWKLGHLLWDEPYDEQIARRARQAANTCAAHAAEIGRASEAGVRALMDGLLESGLCLVAFGSSMPASGMEHHLSHYWEMKLLREGRPAILHGAKVGAATILAAGYYDRLKQLARPQLIERLKKAALPDRAAEIERIKAAYGPLAERVIAAQAPFLDLSPPDHNRLKQKIIDRWPEIQKIAATVPTSQEITTWLRDAGGPTDPRALGLSQAEVALALENAHYFRNRFTVAKLGRLVGF